MRTVDQVRKTIPPWRVERTRDELLRAPISKVEMGFRARCKVRFRNLNPRAQRAVNPCTNRKAWFEACSVQCLTLSTGSCGGSKRLPPGRHEATRGLWWNWWNCKNRAQRAAYKFTGSPIKEVFELRPAAMVDLDQKAEERSHAFSCPVCRGSGRLDKLDAQEQLDDLLFGDTP